MQSTDTTNKLRETLADVIAKHSEVNGDYAVLTTDYVSAAAKGEDTKADKLEIEIEKARRLMQRLALRRAALEQDIGSAEEVEQAARAAKLKQNCDAVLARAGKRIADLEGMAVAIAKEVDALEADVTDWKESRYYAKAAGAAPEGFATQENDARVSRVVESLGLSRIRTGNLAKDLSRVSVTM